MCGSTAVLFPDIVNMFPDIVNVSITAQLRGEMSVHDYGKPTHDVGKQYTAAALQNLCIVVTYLSIISIIECVHR